MTRAKRLPVVSPRLLRRVVEGMKVLQYNFCSTPNNIYLTHIAFISHTHKPQTVSTHSPNLNQSRDIFNTITVAIYHRDGGGPSGKLSRAGRARYFVTHAAL